MIVSACCLVHLLSRLTRPCACCCVPSTACCVHAAVALPCSRSLLRSGVSLRVQAAAAPARPATPATSDVDTAMTPKQLGFTMPGMCVCWLVARCALDFVSRPTEPSACDINEGRQRDIQQHRMLALAGVPRGSMNLAAHLMTQQRHSSWPTFPSCGPSTIPIFRPNTGGASNSHSPQPIAPPVPAGEFEKHAGCWMGWPYDKYLWREDVSSDSIGGDSLVLSDTLG
jgi:hypothetical protein